MLNAPFPPIETTRLCLRCVTLEDAVPTSALMSPAVSDWLASWPLPFTVEMAKHRIDLARAVAIRGDALPCAIVVKQSETLAGWITLSRSDDDINRGALGYWLGEAYHRQGFTREALSALIPAGFDRLNLEVIEAGAQAENAGSIAVMRACGMFEVGERMVHATSRGRLERCIFYETRRPASSMRRLD